MSACSRTRYATAGWSEILEDTSHVSTGERLRTRGYVRFLFPEIWYRCMTALVAFCAIIPRKRPSLQQIASWHVLCCRPPEKAGSLAGKMLAANRRASSRTAGRAPP